MMRLGFLGSNNNNNLNVTSPAVAVAPVSTSPSGASTASSRRTATAHSTRRAKKSKTPQSKSSSPSQQFASTATTMTMMNSRMIASVLLVILLSVVAAADNSTSIESSSSSISISADEVVVIVPQDGWSEEQLRCLNDMETADTSYDHILNHHEYFVFADLLADRMFGMVNALDEESEWQLDELYEDLVLLNPRSAETTGLDIFGSAFGQLRNVNDKQANYLKTICTRTRQAIDHIGPDDGEE